MFPYVKNDLQKLSSIIKNIQLSILDRLNTYIYIHIYIHTHINMVFITEGFLEVAIESWPEWDLNPRPMNSIQNLVAIKLRVLIVNTKQIY